MSGSRLPIIGISMGDPAGIGPEICVKALAFQETYDLCRPIVVGDAAVMADAVRFCGLGFETASRKKVSDGIFTLGTIDVYDLANLPIDKLRHKQVTAEQGRASFEYVAKVIELAMAGELDATVTGPINKAAINAGGFHYAGHTEIYAELTRTRDYSMMLAEGDFRVAHVSTHVSLKTACERVKKERVLTVIRLAHRRAADRRRRAQPPLRGRGALWGRRRPRDRPGGGGRPGRGHPGRRAASSRYGLFKDARGHVRSGRRHVPRGQMAGVNVTLGLPIIRVSVDHGTAFGKAGEGRANPQSMIEAIKLAARLAAGRETR
ncbi:MAG: 4-hydroxythreonine-4-phosphate dehydrogenase PdxA [Desulfobacterales bacterium]|nr:4-hydroxythreonine-4-phosphate dehydrogenase PdxA [Desulfobacterales bacterium]